MIDNKLVLIDSNILVYAYDLDEKEKNMIANKILVKVTKNEMDIALSIQNLSEFYINATKKIEKPIDPKEAKSHIKDWLSFSNIKILKIREHTILNAIDTSIAYGIPYWDSLIVSVMQENNIDKIITENKLDFKKIPWLNVINPFK